MGSGRCAEMMDGPGPWISRRREIKDLPSSSFSQNSLIGFEHRRIIQTIQRHGDQHIGTRDRSWSGRKSEGGRRGRERGKGTEGIAEGLKKKRNNERGSVGPGLEEEKKNTTIKCRVKIK